MELPGFGNRTAGKSSILILRTATSAAVDALLDVQEPGAVEGLAHIFPQDQHPFPREAIGSRWWAEIADPKVNVYLYTEHEGTIQGFAAVGDYKLLHFGTALDTWGTGLASGFHDALLDATARRITQPTLTLRVFEENRRARRFYEKHGWQLTGRSSRTTFPPHPLLLEYKRQLTQLSRMHRPSVARPPARSHPAGETRDTGPPSLAG